MTWTSETDERSSQSKEERKAIETRFCPLFDGRVNHRPLTGDQVRDSFCSTKHDTRENPDKDLDREDIIIGIQAVLPLLLLLD